MLSISGITLTFDQPSEINGMLLAHPTTRFQESTIDLIQQNFGNRVKIQGQLEENAIIAHDETLRHFFWENTGVRTTYIYML